LVGEFVHNEEVRLSLSILVLYEFELGLEDAKPVGLIFLALIHSAILRHKILESHFDFTGRS